MKNQFREKLFEKIQSEMRGVTGKQRDIAKAVEVTQKDVSLIKLGRIESFSTDKLIDMASKCGWSFSFEVVAGDRAAISGAVAKGEADLKASLDAINFDLDDL